MEEISTWRIMVPVASNQGNVYTVEYHQAWDHKVKEIAGGLTISKPTKGYWVDVETGEDNIEKMIPVEIDCTESQIREIGELTKEYYEQQAVRIVRVSDKVIMI